MTAEQFAESLKAKLTMPSKPLLTYRQGEADRYYVDTNVAETWRKAKAELVDFDGKIIRGTQ